MNSNMKDSVMHTGTTILGIVCKDGVVMAADRRMTAGSLILGKDAEKVKQINDYLVTSWTGSASDALLAEKILAAELKLKELKTKIRPSVKEAANLLGMSLYRNIRTPSMVPSIVGGLVAGFNEDGTTELYSVEPAGGVYKIKEYDANFSSGMPFVLGFLERQWKPGLSLQEGVHLAVESIKSSTQRDVGSGNGIDVFTITKDGIKKVVSQEIVPSYN